VWVCGIVIEAEFKNVGSGSGRIRTAPFERTSWPRSGERSPSSRALLCDLRVCAAGERVPWLWFTDTEYCVSGDQGLSSKECWN
jgi:hypothetical protein